MYQLTKPTRRSSFSSTTFQKDEVPGSLAASPAVKWVAGAVEPPGHAGQPGHGGHTQLGIAGQAGMWTDGHLWRFPPQRYASAPCQAYWAAGSK